MDCGSTVHIRSYLCYVRVKIIERELFDILKHTLLALEINVNNLFRRPDGQVDCNVSFILVRFNPSAGVYSVVAPLLILGSVTEKGIVLD